MTNLLLEIGTEEIPAGYIKPALKSLSSSLLEKLTNLRIEYDGFRVYGTPRRLSIEVTGVSSRQKPLIKQITGPPVSVAFDENGRPGKAVEKFAEKAGVSIRKLKRKKTKKGLYLCAEIKEKGVLTKQILKTILPEVILSTPFPKTMRWSDLDIEFARPIHSILALFGKSVISFKVGDVKSGRYTYGHYFMHPVRIKIESCTDYIEVLQNAYVNVDIEQRKKEIENNISNTALKLGGRIVPDDELIDTVTNLVEYPTVVAGSFDTKFLKLPDEVLTTSMREHQKYFSIIDDNKKLMPYFIAVNNTKANNISQVTKGHEKVLRSRLEDAMFFYKTDLKISFDTRIEDLKGVLFQSKLGSLYEKVVRARKVAGFIANTLKIDPLSKDHVLRAAWLCKADLVSHMVVEFPKLQGIMGRVYAQIAGEPAPVATAIEEHYLPIYSGGKLPETMTGAILSIADKVDSICGCFCVGLIPTGATDPYALRRQGIGIIQIMLENNFSFSLRRLIEMSLKLFENQHPFDFAKTADQVFSFLQNRMTHILIGEGFAKDTIAAIVSTGADCVPDVLNRARALQKLKAEPDFEPIATAFKRVVNIITKSAGYKDKFNEKDIDVNLFCEESESNLYSSYKKVERLVSENMNKGDFDQALHDIALLRKPVDDFFDNVLVMTEDITLRNNRLALLSNISKLFGTFADFSKISA